jgi:hypothetical protein
MLSMETRTAKLVHMNPRTERHGEESVKAADLKVQFDASNAILNEFCDGLLDALYEAPPEPEATHPDQLFTKEDAPIPALPKVIRRWKLMPAFKWGLEMVGRKVTIAYGLGGDSDVVLDGCTVDKFEFTLLDGGTVSVTFRVKGYPDSDQIAALYELLDSEVDITIELGKERNKRGQLVLDDGDDDPAPGDDGDTDDDPDPFAGSDLARNRQPEEA